MGKRKTVIDEELMRRMIGKGGPLLDAPEADSESKQREATRESMKPARAAETQHAEPPVPEQSAEVEQNDPRRRRIALPDFEQTFLKPLDIRNRSSLYVSGQTKRKILDVIRMIGSDRMTVTSYVENILRQHLMLYKDDINRIYKERKIENLL